jgi:hypothetical protein
MKRAVNTTAERRVDARKMLASAESTVSPAGYSLRRTMAAGIILQCSLVETRCTATLRKQGPRGFGDPSLNWEGSPMLSFQVLLAAWNGTGRKELC